MEALLLHYLRGAAICFVKRNQNREQPQTPHVKNHKYLTLKITACEHQYSPVLVVVRMLLFLSVI